MLLLLCIPVLKSISSTLGWKSRSCKQVITPFATVPEIFDKNSEDKILCSSLFFQIVKRNVEIKSRDSHAYCCLEYIRLPAVCSV